MLSARTLSLNTAIWPLQYAALVAAMSVIFGCDLGTLFINQQYLSNLFLLSLNRSHVIIGTYILGFIFGTFISGYVTYGSGRKITIVSSSLVGSFAILASAVAPNFAIFLCSEFVIGFSFGLFFIAACLYNCELMLPSLRGTALSFIPIGTACGTLLSLITYTDPVSKPLVVFIVLVILNLILLATTVIKLPESPRYLALTGSTDAALAVLFKLRHDMGMAARELAEINECCRGENRSLEFYIQNTIYRRLLAFICVSTFVLNMAGSFIIPYVLLDNLSLVLLCEENNYCYYDLNSALIYTTFTLIFISVLLHALALTRFSRRFIVLFSLATACTFLAITTITSLLPHSDLKNYILTIALLAFIFFGMGFYSIFMCVLIPELLPIRGREFGFAAIVLAQGIGQLFSLQAYTPMIHQLGFSSFLAVATLLMGINLYFLYLFLPPLTGQKSLEGIELRVMSLPKFMSLRHLNSAPTSNTMR